MLLKAGERQGRKEMLQYSGGISKIKTLDQWNSI